MLIIAISHGREHLDPFSRTCICEDGWVDPFEMVSLLSFIYQEMNTLPSNLDQVIVVHRDQILVEYDNEDGLGDEDQDQQLEIRFK